MKIITMSSILSIIALLFIGCISPQQMAQSVWSKESNLSQYYFIRPRVLKTTEEAISTIKLNQPNFCEVSGNEIVELNVDQFGLIMKTRWVTYQTNYVVSPVTQYGFSNGLPYSNTTYVGRNQTTTNSGIDTLALQFKKLNFISLVFLNNTNYNYKWQIGFLIKSNGEFTGAFFRAKDEQTAHDFINAVYSLATKAEAVFKLPVLGTENMPLNPQQKATLGIESLQGLVIKNIFFESPAARSGLQVNDIITKIDGKNVLTDDDLDNALRLRKNKKAKITIIRMSDFDETKNIYNHEVLVKEVSLQ